MAALAHLGSGGKLFVNEEVLRELDKQGFFNSLQKKRGETMMKSLALLCLLLLPSACAEEVSHDEKLATARAVEFAETTFVRRNMERGYDLQADKVRSYVPLDKFIDKVKLMHRGGFPSKVTAAGAVPVKGEKLMHVRLRGEGGGERYEYGVTLTGTAATDYRVTNFSGGRTS